MLRDQFVATPQPQQRSGAGELAFREQTNDLAGGELFGGRSNRRTRMAGVDWNTADRAQKRAEQRFVIKFLIDDVTNRARRCEL